MCLPFVCQWFIHQKKSWGHLRVTSGVQFSHLRMRWLHLCFVALTKCWVYDILQRVNSNQVDLQHVKIDWFPSYSELKLALENYGFLFNSSNMEYVHSSKFSYRHPVFMQNLSQMGFFVSWKQTMHHFFCSKNYLVILDWLSFTMCKFSKIKRTIFSVFKMQLRIVSAAAMI